MSDKVKFYRSTENSILTRPIENGALYFATDTPKIYMDDNNIRTCYASLTDADRRINENLLDNAYWANPDAIVDQRGGYIIPKGTLIYRDSALTQLIGPAATPCPVVTQTSTYVEVAEPNNLNTHYYAPPGTAVRGYCQRGYTIDRWRTWDNGVVVTITSNGLDMEMASTPDNPGLISPLVQYLEFERFPANTPLTASILVGDKLLVSTGSTDTGVPQVSTGDFYMGCVKEANSFGFYFSLKNGTKISGIKAAKLELGPYQTLAYESGGGGYKLIDPAPNYQQELAKCLRYQRVLSEGWLGWGIMDSNTAGQFALPIGIPMRVRPTISGTFNIYNEKNNLAVNSIVPWLMSGNAVNGQFVITSGTDISAGDYVIIHAHSPVILDANI